jgi:PAS domain S-box-containing protein
MTSRAAKAKTRTRTAVSTKPCIPDVPSFANQLGANGSIISFTPVSQRDSPAQPSYQDLLRFFHESIDLLCIAGFDGVFKQLNPAWQSVLGWTVQELEATPFLDFVHPNDRPATLAEMEKLLGGGNTITFENRYQRKDGSWKWLQWTAAPLPGRQEIYAVARDVTLQKEVEKKIHDAMDRERSRIGRDLHDSLGPHLAAIGYAASFLTNELRRGDQLEEAEQAERIRQMVGEAMSHAHELARGLVPVQMGGSVLCQALEDLARTTSRLRGILVYFQQTGDPQAETVEDGVHLYRIAQEAVNNSARHGGATRVTIILSRTNGALRLTVVDDGKGMTSLRAGMSGIGLPSMRYRAQSLGGELKIEANPDGGTIVSCEISNYPRLPVTPAS